jgi:alpha-beta hydrolase superfamily lysophospholipase
MVQNESFFESHDGTRLFLYRWTPEQTPKVKPPKAKPPKAALHIVHGMAEHALRYKRLAEKLTAQGIEVWAADQRGHGKTADLSVNKPDRGGLLGHCGDGAGFVPIIKDIHALNTEIKKTINSPLFLLGHSWGSFLVQDYIEEYSGSMLINGCILSGTKGPAANNLIFKAGIPILSFLAAVRGQRKGSNLAKAMADGPYNKPFKPNRTSFDWISRDEKEVDKYIADPFSGMLCSTGFYRELAKLLYHIHQGGEMEKINRNLPVYIFAGSDDPVGDMGASPAALVNAYRNLGIVDLESALYQGARHETLNEINREEVMDNLLSWLKKHFE